MVFRQSDARYPFLWEGSGQPAGRWHTENDGPAHYFADTPHGAWAEFLRHEEITEPADLATIRRQIWTVDIDDAPAATPTLPLDTLVGGLDTYPHCQAEARRLRANGAERLVAPSAALLEGGAAGLTVDGGVQAGPSRDGRVFVVFGSPRGLTGHLVADAGRPALELLERVRHFATR